MPTCTCPTDTRKIAPKDRVYVLCPDRIDPKTLTITPGIGYIFAKSCPVHGWSEVVNDSEVKHGSETSELPDEGAT